MAHLQADAVSKGELRLCARLGLDESGTQSLLAAMRAGASSRSAVVLTARAPEGYAPPFACDTLDAGWLPPRVYVPAAGEKPTSYPDYAEGFY